MEDNTRVYRYGGISRAAAALELKQKYRIEMPIVEAVDAVVNKGESASAVVASLMSRSKKAKLSDVHLHLAIIIVKSYILETR